jgi:hypothetical protein
MTKKVIDFNRLPKQEYQKPVMKVIELQHKSQILAGSVTSVKTTGLDDDLILPDDEEPKSGDVWEEAW